MFVHLHNSSFFKEGKLYWQIFLKPMLLDKRSVWRPLSLRDSSLCHPMLFCKSNISFPEIGQLVKSNSLSSGCFALSILLNVFSWIFMSSLEQKYLNAIFGEKGNQTCFRCSEHRQQFLLHSNMNLLSNLLAFSNQQIKII